MKQLLITLLILMAGVPPVIAQDIYNLDPLEQSENVSSSLPLPINYGYDASGNRTSKGVMVNPDDSIIIGPGGLVTLSIGPSPTQGTVTISLSSWDSSNNYSVGIYGLSGQCVASKVSSNAVTTLDISSQTDGIYVVEVDLGDRKETVKIIKE